MYSNFKKLIFKFDPETAHDLAIKALKTNLFPKIPSVITGLTSTTPALVFEGSRFQR